MWRALLRLYPSEFQDEYGADMVATLEHAYLHETGSARLRFAASATTDLVRTAIQEHRHLMIRDITQSFRRMLGQPAVATVAVLSLALGIGAGTTMFSVLYSAILRPLNYPDADRRVALFTTGRQNKAIRNLMTSSDFIDWRAASRTLDQWHLTAFSHATTAIVDAVPERVRVASATPGLMQALGAQPLLGRFPGADDPNAWVISEGYWHRRFGASTTALGKKIRVGNEVRTIAAVVPNSFELFEEPGNVDFWSRIDLSPGSDWVGRTIPWLMAIAHLKPGVTLSQAQAEMDSLAAGLAKAYPETNRERGVHLTPIMEARNGNLSEFLLPLFGAVSLVLLIACSNVANLLLARSVTRRREVSVRAALGASRKRLMREFFIDGLVLSVPGVLCGILIAYGGIALFQSLAPEGWPGRNSTSLNVPVLLFTAVAGLISGIGASILPAIHGSRVDLTEALKEGGRSSGSRSRQYLRSLIVAGEIALALILLVGAGLMLNSLLRLQNQWLGFTPDQVTVARLDLAGTRYMTNRPKQEIDMRGVEPAVGQFLEHVVGKVQSLPGVQRAAFAAVVPLGPAQAPGVRVHVLGTPESSPRFSSFNVVTPGYFSVLRIALQQGRLFDERDTQAAPWVAVVNEAFVRAHFPDGRALGQVISLGIGPRDRPRQIVGVVRDYKRGSLRGPVDPEIITSHFQNPDEIPGNFQGPRFRSSLIVRSLTPPSPETLSQIVAEFDKELPVFEVNPLNALVKTNDLRLRFYGGFLGLFSAIALLLAAIGIFGLINHSVTDRLHEIGIRASLGASRGQIVWLVASHGLKLAGIGLTAGIIGSVMLGRVLESRLFQVKHTDPATLLSTTLVLLVLTALTSAIPALRATRIDPAVALRTE
jgi:predicted permease